MFLDYLSLAILLMGLTLVFYTFIYIHDLPHKIAKKREHPHEEAIHVACWLSLFTLHAIWPMVYIWAVTHKKPGAGHAPAAAGGEVDPASRLVARVNAAGGDGGVASRLAALELRLKQLESGDRQPGHHQESSHG
jgi:hypothetical protein